MYSDGTDSKGGSHSFFHCTIQAVAMTDGEAPRPPAVMRVKQVEIRTQCLPNVRLHFYIWPFEISDSLPNIAL